MHGENEIKIVLTDVCEKAKKVFGDKLNEVILYGSYARGDYDSESDIDIMMIAEIEQAECWQYTTKLNEQISHIELEHDIVISLSVTEHENFEKYKDKLPFYRNVLKEGVKIAG